MVLSAGLLVWRPAPERPAATEFLLAHPGGPFFRHRDLGAWTVPKGLVEPGEDVLAAARREFLEETGLRVDGPAAPLTPVTLKSRKRVQLFLVKGDISLDGFVSNTFLLEHPKGSGRTSSFPEVDRVAYFSLAEALERISPGQAPALREAALRLDAGARDAGG